LTISVILPAYNEGKELKDNLEALYCVLDSFGDVFELLIMEDGSTDETPRIAKEFSERYSNVYHYHSDERLGKGNAIKNGFGKAIGDYLVFLDADLPVDLEVFPMLIQGLVDGHDIVVGSRYHPESVLIRGAYKTFKSRLYNYIINKVYGTGIRDHQCGFKAFRKSSIMMVFNQVHDSRFFFDTELLVRAYKVGLSILEVPVKWRDSDRKSNINLWEEVIIVYKMIEFIFRLM